MPVLQIMARGWESKSVEAQIEEGERSTELDRKQKSTLSPEQQEKLESLRLSRARIEEQLERAVRAPHRDMLMKALRSIEQEFEAINRSASSSKE